MIKPSDIKPRPKDAPPLKKAKMFVPEERMSQRPLKNHPGLKALKKEMEKK